MKQVITEKNIHPSRFGQMIRTHAQSSNADIPLGLGATIGSVMTVCEGVK